MAKYACKKFFVPDLVIEVFHGDGTPSTVYTNIVTSARDGSDTGIGNDTVIDYGTAFYFKCGLLVDFDKILQYEKWDTYTEEYLKTSSCFAFYSASGDGYPRTYCAHLGDFGMNTNQPAFGHKTFTSPGVVAESHYGVCSIKTDGDLYVTPVVYVSGNTDDGQDIISVVINVVEKRRDMLLFTFGTNHTAAAPFDDFFNGLAFGLRGIGVTAFQPSSSFERGYVAGSDLRNHRYAPVSTEKYNYSGMTCPALPEAAKDYPYIAIYGCADEIAEEKVGSGQYTRRTLYLSTSPICAANITLWGIDAVALTGLSGLEYWTVDYVEDSWSYQGEHTSDQQTVYHLNPTAASIPGILWSNHDIVNTSDGTIVQAASDPIPV